MNTLRCLICIPITVLLLCAPTTATDVPKSAGKNDPNRTVWDLSLIYHDQGAWEKERDFVLAKMAAIGRWKGKLTTSASALADGMDEIADLRGRAGRLAIYGFLVSDTNLNSELAKKQYDVGSSLESQAESAVSFLAAEIRGAGREKIDKWLNEEPRLVRHRARINRIFSEAPHSLDAGSEAILQSAARWPSLSGDVFEAIHESDFGWPVVQNGATAEPLNRSAYVALRTSSDSSERTLRMREYLNALSRLEDVFGLLYTRRIEADLILAKYRKFEDGIQALWFLRDGMPAGSFQVMIDETRKHLKLLQRYAKLRARVIGAMQPSYPDLFAPLSEERRFSLTEARQMAIAASEPVGKTYVAKLRERMHQPWMHLISSPEKRNTYAIWPPVGGTPPFVIMTYQDTYDSARRLTGALTLMMSFEEWRQANAPETRDDPGIYSNGVIYAGDMLFDDYAEAHSQNSGDQIESLIHALDLFRHHYFHWAMNSEFDARVQERIKNGDIPTGKTLSALYLQILREYYGPALSVDESFGKEWMINSVPFYSYEHQFWPAAMAAGCNMIEGLRRQDANAQEAIYQVLGRSNSDRTYSLLLQAGIDLSQPDAYEPVFARMTRLLDKLEKLL